MLAQLGRPRTACQGVAVGAQEDIGIHKAGAAEPVADKGVLALAKDQMVHARLLARVDADAVLGPLGRDLAGAVQLVKGIAGLFGVLAGPALGAELQETHALAGTGEAGRSHGAAIARSDDDTVIAGAEELDGAADPRELLGR